MELRDFSNEYQTGSHACRAWRRVVPCKPFCKINISLFFVLRFVDLHYTRTKHHKHGEDATGLDFMGKFGVQKASLSTSSLEHRSGKPTNVAVRPSMGFD